MTSHMWIELTVWYQQKGQIVTLYNDKNILMFV